MKNGFRLLMGQTIVLTGNSITDAGRREPPYRPFGWGYVHFVANALLVRYRHLNLNIINTGVSGDTIRDLKQRWQKDCIAHSPEILSILIGVNDLYRQYTESEEGSLAVYPREYELTYKRLLSQARQACGCKFILMEPFMFCDDREDQMFQGLRGYIEIVHRLAQEFDATLVPLQSSIDEQIRQVPPPKWSNDSVHPNLWAHAWIAQRWLEVTGL